MINFHRIVSRNYGELTVIMGVIKYATYIRYLMYIYTVYHLHTSSVSIFFGCKLYFCASAWWPNSYDQILFAYWPVIECVIFYTTRYGVENIHCIEHGQYRF